MPDSSDIREIFDRLDSEGYHIQTKEVFYDTNVFCNRNTFNFIFDLDPDDFLVIFKQEHLDDILKIDISDFVQVNMGDNLILDDEDYGRDIIVMRVDNLDSFRRREILGF